MNGKAFACLDSYTLILRVHASLLIIDQQFNELAQTSRNLLDLLFTIKKTHNPQLATNNEFQISLDRII
jgi:hypothetical protein